MSGERKKRVEWQCAHCRIYVDRVKDAGKPAMGICSKNNGKAHMWRKLREY